MLPHFDGANGSFGEENLTAVDLARARIFRYGYPPILRKMYEDGGENLAGFLARAKGRASSPPWTWPTWAPPHGIRRRRLATYPGACPGAGPPKWTSSCRASRSCF
jgi:hypothetical protein